MSQDLVRQFKRLINILITKFGVSQKIQQGDKDQILSHLLSTYPEKGSIRVYNQNFYYTMAYHKLLYILYKKNRHVSYRDPGVEAIINRNVQNPELKIEQKNQTQNFIQFLIGKMLGVNQKFNKTYYLIIIRKLGQFLQNPKDAPLRRRQIIKQICQQSYKNGNKIPKNYIYRVFYVLKKNFPKWKRQYEYKAIA